MCYCYCKRDYPCIKSKMKNIQVLHHVCAKREYFVLYSKYDYKTVEIQSSHYIKPHLGIKDKKLKHNKNEYYKIWIIDATRGERL